MREAIVRDRAVAGLAAKQHGIVTVPQLLNAGFTPGVIKRRLAGGWLVRRHQGVYQVGVCAGRFGDEMAALLASGPRSVLGLWAAMGVWGPGERRGVVEVICLGDAAGRRRGIRAHRAAALPACDVTTRYGLRVTTPPRTLVDLAAATPPAELERLIEEMQVQRLASPAEILEAVRRGAGRPGITKLRDIAHLTR